MTKIKVSANIHASITKAWKFYNQPEHIVNWNFASEDWVCPSASSDFKSGGKYFARMEAKDKSYGFDFEAVFNEIIENKKVTYTITDGRKVEILFSDNQNYIQVDVIFDAENSNPIEMQQQGWQAILNNYKKYVEHN